MSRIRTIKPDFWEDEGVSTLSRDARLLFIATWNLADDEGLLRWTADFIKAQVFPYDADLTVAKVKKLMAELVEGDFIFAYKAGRVHQQLAFVVRFLQHQRINRPQPGKLPPPPYGEVKVREMLGRRDGMVCGICSEAIEAVTDPWHSCYDYIEGNRYHEQERQKLSVDHIVPRSKGGHNYPSNLQASHISCNKGRGNRSLPDSGNGSVNEDGNDSLLERKGSETEVVDDVVNEPVSDGTPPSYLESKRNPDALVELVAERFKQRADLG